MLRLALLAGCLGILALTTVAAADDHVPGSGGITLKPLVQPQLVMTAPPPPTPFPMTYSEEVAQRLGVNDGGLAIASSGRANPYMPSVSFDGMLRLQWRP